MPSLSRYATLSRSRRFGRYCGLMIRVTYYVSFQNTILTCQLGRQYGEFHLPDNIPTRLWVNVWVISSPLTVWIVTPALSVHCTVRITLAIITPQLNCFTVYHKEGGGAKSRVVKLGQSFETAWYTEWAVLNHLRKFHDGENSGYTYIYIYISQAPLTAVLGQ